MAARRAGSRGAGWSRFVRAAKIVLPLLALAALSSVFLVASRPGEASLDVPFAEVERAAEEQRIGRPRFAGVTGSGDAIELRARAARPLADGSVAAEDVTARLTGPSGRVDLDAATGTLAEGLVFGGGVRVVATGGWRLTAPRITAALDRTDLVAEGPVAGAGPFGAIEAGGMRLTEAGLVFHDGVRVLYEPAP